MRMGDFIPTLGFRILEKAHDTLHKFQVQFGGLPAVRSRVTARKPEKKNAFGDCDLRYTRDLGG